MSEQPKKIIRITVCAPEPGKLGLVFDYADGSSSSSLATVSTVRLVLADHGHAISSEALAGIAFSGHRRVLNFPAANGRLATPAPASRLN
jgi:hypothetical protein